MPPRPPDDGLSLSRAPVPSHNFRISYLPKSITQFTPECPAAFRVAQRDRIERVASGCLSEELVANPACENPHPMYPATEQGE